MNLYKSAVLYLLRGRKTFLIPVLFSNYMTAALKLLKKLYKVTLGDGVGWGCRTKYPARPLSGRLLTSLVLVVLVFCFDQVNLKVKHVEYDTFYIPEISSLVDIQEDYLMWFLHQAGMVRVHVKHILKLWPFCVFVFFFFNVTLAHCGGPKL